MSPLNTLNVKERGAVKNFGVEQILCVLCALCGEKTLHLKLTNNRSRSENGRTT